jgi:hypothetical protein
MESGKRKTFILFQDNFIIFAKLIAKIIYRYGILISLDLFGSDSF